MYLPRSERTRKLGPDLDTLVTTLYVTIDDLLVRFPDWAPRRPVVGIAPQLSDAELVCLAVIQPLLGFDSEARFIRFARAHLRPWFPYLPNRAGYNKRLRRSVGLLQEVTAWLGRNSPSWFDDLWLMDSTPIECGRSRETVKRSELGGWAEYGYSASHSRYFWGLRLHMVATPAGLPIAWALTGAKTDERKIAAQMLTHDGIARKGQTIIADKGYKSAHFEKTLQTSGIALIRPATKTEQPRPDKPYLRTFRQTIESIFDTLKNQLGLERHGGRTPTGVTARILQRILALTAVIWHNQTTNQPGPARSLTAYDH